MTDNVAATRIAGFALPCTDIVSTARFYTQAFGCREAGAPNELLLGEQRLVLDRATGPGLNAPPSNSTAFQHCAIIVSDMAAAMERLTAVSGWTAISLEGPERLPEASGGATAFKFRDPDGHPLELLQFPTNAVPNAWRGTGPGPFLGIDHSAITVADTGRAVAFWTGLGFRVTERHVNRGPEQARMDGIGESSAVVEVTTLMPVGGAPAHLELLCYEIPAPLPAPAPDGSPFATTLLLRGAPPLDGPAADPDGHRFHLVRP